MAFPKELRVVGKDGYWYVMDENQKVHYGPFDKGTTISIFQDKNSLDWYIKTPALTHILRKKGESK